MMMLQLKKGDLIHIVSPSGVIDPTYIDKAAEVLRSWGYRVEAGRYAKEIYGRFAGTVEQRVHDLQHAIDDPGVKAILCSRGGYGLSQIVDKINYNSLLTHPKCLIGFSDITILHSVFSGLSVPSIHGIMAKHISELNLNDDTLSALKNIFEGKYPDYQIDSQAENRTGEASGMLVGGNLSVLMALRGSKFDLDYAGKILFIEDIGEKPYHIDRMMQNLRFSGVLGQISGLIVGHFTDCPEDPLMMKSVRQVIFDAVGEYHYPVCFGFPSGHEDENLPLILGSKVQLAVHADGVHLKFTEESL